MSATRAAQGPLRIALAARTSGLLTRSRIAQTPETSLILECLQRNGQDLGRLSVLPLQYPPHVRLFSSSIPRTFASSSPIWDQVRGPRDPQQAEREAGTVAGARLARAKAEQLNQQQAREQGKEGASDGNPRPEGQGQGTGAGCE